MDENQIAKEVVDAAVMKSFTPASLKTPRRKEYKKHSSLCLDMVEADREAQWSEDDWPILSPQAGNRNVRFGVES